jgi:hypothetical protein
MDKVLDEQPKTEPKPVKKTFILHPPSFILLFFYLLVAIVFTWPLALNLGNRVMLAESGDVWQHIWNNWWMRFSLLNLHTHPYTTPLLFYPVGADLYFHALDPMDGYLSTPFQLLFGVVAAFNLNVFFQVTIAGWGVYLLARYLTNNYGAALVAGLIYACSPLESRLLNLGQLELTSIEWLPLYILCFLKALNREARPWLWRGLSVVFLLVLSLDSWYYLLYAVIFSLLFTLYKLWQQRREWRQAWFSIALVAGGIMLVYGLLILPVLLPTLREAGSGGTQQKIYNVIYNSTTLKGLFTTGPSALWGLLGSADNPEFRRGNFLGYIALALAGLGLFTRFKQGWFWAMLGLVFIVLAMGPVFHFQFEDWPSSKEAEVGLSMPGKLLYYLPFGNIARVPLRYTLVTMLALAVLAAYGLDWLAKKGAEARWKLLIPALAGLLVFLEFFPGPRTLADTTVPAFYTQLRNEGQWNDFAVLETPDGGSASIVSQAMYYQTVHQHPIVGGYLSRKPDYPFRDFPGIAELLNLDYRVFQRDIIDRASLSNTPALLQYYKIRYVIIHPALLKDENSRYNAQSVLQTVFGHGAKPYYQDDQLQVWKTPEVVQNSSRPDAAKILPQLADGWGGREDNPGGAERVVGQQARLVLFNPYQQNLPAQVQVKVRAKTGQPRLTTVLNGQSVTDQTVEPAATPLNINLTLKPGLNEVIFKTTGPVYFGAFLFKNP